MIAKKSEAAHIKPKTPKRAKGSYEDVLEQMRGSLKQMVNENSHEQTADKSKVQEEVKRKIESMLNCSVCLNTAKMPAAVCPACFKVVGCVPCVEQWLESSDNTAKCPLCRSNKKYVLLPIVREIAEIVGQPVKEQEDDNESTTSTIPYNDSDHDSDQELMQPAF